MSNTASPDIAAILAVFRRFSRSESEEQSDQRFGYEDGVASKIQALHSTGRPIYLLLPAAPFKNPCPEKVLDTKSPDFAEELGLSRLNHLCDELAKVYPFGAQVTMVSDGPVYNDLLCIPDSDFYDYGLKLRQLAADNGFTRIRFRRLADVLGIANGDVLSKDEYLALAGACRREMETRFLPQDFDAQRMIQDDKDTNLTYQGFIKLANDDLRWGPSLDPEIRNNADRYAEETKKVAERMIKRLLAYEKSLEAAFPEHIRLSIHRSTGTKKISLPLIPQVDGFGLQPWHCCVMVTAQGNYITGYSKDYRDNDAYEIVMKNGRPYYIREKHEDFNWPAHIELQHTYGGRIIIKNTLSEEGGLSSELKIKLANLALRFGSIETVGFQI